MSRTGVITIYATVDTAAEAENVAHLLVTERVVASATIIPGASSVFRSEGKVVKVSEVAMLFQANHGNADQVIARLKALHPAKLPCILAWPVDSGDTAYLRWVRDNAN